MAGGSKGGRRLGGSWQEGREGRRQGGINRRMDACVCGWKYGRPDGRMNAMNDINISKYSL